MQNALLEHSAILLTCIKLPPVFKTFILPIFEWLLKTGFTVFAVSELWLEWLQDEVGLVTEDSDRERIETLFDKAVKDYLCKYCAM